MQAFVDPVSDEADPTELVDVGEWPLFVADLVSTAGFGVVPGVASL